MLIRRLILVLAVLLASAEIAGAQTATPTPTNTPTPTPTFTPVPTAVTGLSGLQLNPSSTTQSALVVANPSATPVVWVSGSGVLQSTVGARLAIQNGAHPGASCATGEIFIDTDETDDAVIATTADNSLLLCVAANTWAKLENN